MEPNNAIVVCDVCKNPPVCLVVQGDLIDSARCPKCGRSFNDVVRAAADRIANAKA